MRSLALLFILIATMGVSGGTNEFTLVQKSSNKQIQPANFIASASFSFRSIYDGVTSNRSEFAQALRESGVRGLRFPGGTMSHFYMWEGKAVTDELKIDIDPVKPLTWNLYSPVNYTGQTPNVNHWPKKYYTPIADFLSFCEEEAFIPLLQVNTSFYYDGVAGKTRAICRTQFITNYSSGASIVSEYWDRDRIEEAADRLATNIQAYVIDPGYGSICKYWEIGNEDYVQYDWNGNGNSDDYERYAELLAKYADVIKDKIPDAEIYFAGETWYDNVLGWISANAPSSLSKITGMGKHYPFGAWPVASSTAMADDPEAFVVTDVEFDDNIAGSRSNLDALGYTNVAVATTETTMWKLEGTYPWNGRGLCATTSRALMTAHNFGKLVFCPEKDNRLTVSFDLTSPYFGFLPYHAWFVNTATSTDLPYVKILRPEADASNPNSDDFWTSLNNPLSNVSTNRRTSGYFITPAARVMNFFSGMSGKQLISVGQTAGTEFVSVFSAYGGGSTGELQVVIVNRTAASQYISLKNYDQFLIPFGNADASILEASHPQTGATALNAVFSEGEATDEYQFYTESKYVRGSGYADDVFFNGWVEPWSVVFLPIEGVSVKEFDPVISREEFVAAGTAQPASGVYEADTNIAASPNSSVTGGGIVGFGTDWLSVAGPMDGSTTSLYKPRTDGLTTAAITHPSGGSLAYGGYNDSLTRRVRRPLDSYTGTDTYYMSGLMKAGTVDSNGTSLMGFTDNYSNADFEGGSDFFGLMWGYVNGNAVIRHRTGAGTIVNSVLGSAVAGQTDLFVLKLERDVSGYSDRVTVWLNPEDVAAEGSTAHTAQFLDVSLSSQTDIDRLTFISKDWSAGGDVQFDEPRFGTTWDSVVSSSESTTIYLAIEPLSGTTNAAISWNTDDWLSYALQATTNLTGGAWSDIVTNIVGTGSSVTHTTAVSQANSFYRVRVEE